jgi:hypothetical protein
MSDWSIAMGRVELNHYPASKLPDDLRGDIGVDASVNIIIEEDVPKVEPMTRAALMAMLNRSSAGPDVSLDDAVKRIRDLRDEWED